jgi:hypothetical protein
MSAEDDTSDVPAWGVPHPADVVVHVDASRAGPTPPHSLEAEREVLAAALLDSRALESVAAIPAWAWYSGRHATIAATMIALEAHGTPVDPVTLQQSLRDRGVYEQLGGARAIGELMDRAGTVANVEHYARVVVAKARLRRLIEVARRIEVAAYQDVDDVDAFVAEAGASVGATLADVAPRLPIDLRTLAELGADNWFTEPPPRADALLTWSDGHRQPLLMAAGRVSLLAAAGGVGKTYALVQLALAIATGTPWLGTFQVPRKGRVLLALAEEDLDEIRRRLYMAAQTFGQPGDDGVDYLLSEVRRNVVPMALMGHNVAFLGPDGPTRWHADLCVALGGQTWRAIILDPLSRWGGPEIETDAHAATRVVQLLEQLTALPGAPAVIVAHHTNKGALRDDPSQRNQGIVRGHSALVDGARWVGYLERLTGRERRSRLSVVKSNYGPTPPALELTRDGSGALRPMQPHELEVERDETETARKKGRRHDLADRA